ncbi:UNVERIFIED_CONTAM: hypothetical protein FKN15_066051 [Acipenser sinensis]
MQSHLHTPDWESRIQPQIPSPYQFLNNLMLKCCLALFRTFPVYSRTVLLRKI